MALLGHAFNRVTFFYLVPIMINPETETLVSLTDVAKSLPGRPNITTIWRAWQNRGIRGVRLETILIGGRHMTSREAMARFFAATTAAADGRSVRYETPRHQERDSAGRRRSCRTPVGERYTSARLNLKCAKGKARSTPHGWICFPIID